MALRFVLLLALVDGIAHADSFLLKRNSRPLQAESALSALEPWETPISGFFIRSHHEVPVVDADQWTLVIDGLVDNPLTLRLKDLAAYPETSLHAVLECAGNGRSLHKPQVPGVQWERGAVGNAEWTGIAVADLLAKAKPRAEAKFARVEGADKPAMPGVPPFVRSIPLEKMREKSTLLALKMNREPMPVLHGGPLRLILPNWYGQNWIKWVTHITLEAKEDGGFYMKKGYRMPKTAVKPGEKWDSATGVPVEQILVQSLIVAPRPGQAIAVGSVAVSGKAFSGGGAITKVEISTNGGKSWSPAQLEPAHPDGGWQEFSARVEARKLGALTLLARATDSTGALQPLEPQWNPPGYLRNWVDRITVRIVKTAPVAEEKLFQEKCLTCHTGEMVSQQRLSAEGWDKTVTKMETAMGLKLTPEEHKALARYLAQEFAVDRPAQAAVATDYSLEAGLVEPPEPEGNSSRGAKLYSQNCAACHGDQGEGKSAPRLRGRVVTAANFWASVTEGRHSMPSFKESLPGDQIADLRAFLNRPL